MPVIHELLLPNRTHGKCYKRYAVTDNKTPDHHLVYIDICTDFKTGEGFVEIYAFDREAKRKNIHLKTESTNNPSNYGCFSLERVANSCDDQEDYRVTHNSSSQHFAELSVKLENELPMLLSVKTAKKSDSDVWQLSLF